MDQNEIFERARALGRLLADQPRVKTFREAQQRLEKDEQARRLLRDYQLLADKLQREQAQGRQPGQPDVEQLNRLQDELAGSQAIKAWLRAQTDLVELMFNVDHSIQQGMAPAGATPAGVTGPPGGQVAKPQTPQPFAPAITPPSGKAEA